MKKLNLIAILAVLTIAGLFVHTWAADGLLQNLGGTTSTGGSVPVGSFLTNNSTIGWTNTGNIQSATLNGTTSLKGGNLTLSANTLSGTASILITPAGGQLLNLCASSVIVDVATGFTGFNRSPATGAGSPTINVSGDGGFSARVLATNGVVSRARNQLAPVSITVGASPFSFTNNAASNGSGTNTIMVNVHSGTVSDIALNGTTIQATTGHLIPLQPDEWITITYSSSPTANWKPF